MPELNDYTIYHGHAYKVECPHCGASEGDICAEVTHKGPVGGYLRSPHQERAELSRGAGHD